MVFPATLRHPPLTLFSMQSLPLLAFALAIATAAPTHAAKPAAPSSTSILESLRLRLPPSATATELCEAAAAGDVPRIRALVQAGQSPDARDADGLTPLMRAAAQGRFGALRELLWLHADPALVTTDAKLASDLIAPDGEDARAGDFILRAYAYHAKNARPPVGPPARPHLVMLFEPTVNYLHPRIKPAYYANLAEALGKPGLDDDANGFIDDVHGWNLASDTAHAIDPLQFQLYLQSRETIGRLFHAYNENREGRLPDADYQALRAGYDNPLARIFGGGAGFTNGDFLDKAIDLSHGSHVAGIVLEHSRGSALLHTLSWQAFGDAASPEIPLDRLATDAADLNDFLERVRQVKLDHSLATGRRLSDYLRATGAGIVNMSMGSDYSAQAAEASALASAYLQAAHLEVTEANQADFETFLQNLALEFYAADAVRFLVPMLENPDVLFVIAAGNSNENNDSSYQSPAYLARLVPNAICVAAADAAGDIAAFSNFGPRSVDLAAPGVAIVSTAIPESSVLMDGTSMAAPAVAGAAAYVRKALPSLSAADLRRYLLYTSAARESLAPYVSTGGNLDATALFALVSPDATERARAFFAAAARAVALDPVACPQHLADAAWLSTRALQP